MKSDTLARWGCIAVIAICCLLMVRSLPLGQLMESLNDWVRTLGVWGPLVLVLLYIVATVLFVPGTILTLAAGALFGLAIGMVVVSIGSTVGAALAFLIARYVAREKVAQVAKSNPRFAAIDRAIGEGGWKIVGLLRLSPALPFNLQNYLYGLTPIRFGPYVLTSWIAMMPGTFLYVYLGHVTGAAVGGDRDRTTAEWVLLGVGLLATIVVTVYVTRLASRQLSEQTTGDMGTKGESQGELRDGDAVDQVESRRHTNSSDQASSRGTSWWLFGVAAVIVPLTVWVVQNQSAIEGQLNQWLKSPG
ncbi:TVP38/TMEM64 family protein [Rhodopirellula sp. JC740]|uniref:TVP38/TMEM64 family membrane protein n=1 Tax=Rhodopirellula halodulae TaxID=2894198 RepID=A0ABS8NH59_9BACT|nr:TVP38/TMEM64 family protein [Rhodopirellula sp. JC740]MCC9642889.1 TVP38/TMEM64 family protein [Rhodopirellula sp. JC740]